VEAESFRAMNSEIVLMAEGEMSQIKSGLAAAQKFIEESEKRFTRFSEQSELSQLNRSAGNWFQSSPDRPFCLICIARDTFKAWMKFAASVPTLSLSPASKYPSPPLSRYN
jgi:thiamine biosynthesis lipoprotein ApbE